MTHAPPCMTISFSRMVGAQILAISDSDNGAIRLVDLVNQNTSTLFGNGSRHHIHGDAATAKGSAIWGISGTLDSRYIIFTEADSNSIRQVAIHSAGNDDRCTLSTPPPLPVFRNSSECGDIPGPQEVLQTSTYLFTNGDSGFLSANGLLITDSKLPPSTTPTSTMLSLPHGVVVNPTVSASIRAMRTVTPTDVKLFIKTPDVYVDTCRYPSHCLFLCIFLRSNTCFKMIDYPW